MYGLIFCGEGVDGRLGGNGPVASGVGMKPGDHLTARNRSSPQAALCCSAAAVYLSTPHWSSGLCNEASLNVTSSRDISRTSPAHPLRFQSFSIFECTRPDAAWYLARTVYSHPAATSEELIRLIRIRIIRDRICGGLLSSI